MPSFGDWSDDNGNGGGFATPSGYPDQTPPFGSDPGSVGLAGGGTNLYDAMGGLGGQGNGFANPYASMAGQGNGWVSPYNPLGGNGGPGLGTPAVDPYDPSHLDQLIPILTEPLPSGIGLGIGFPVPGGYADQTPTFGSDPGSAGLAGGWPSDTVSGIDSNSLTQLTQTQNLGDDEIKKASPTQQQIKDLIDYWARYKGVPEEMIPLLQRMAEVESTYRNIQEKTVDKRTGIETPSDHIGIYQLGPAAAAEGGISKEDRWDVNKNIMAGTEYFLQQLDRFNGSIPMALGAFKEGPGGLIASGNNSNLARRVRSYVSQYDGYYNPDSSWNRRQR